MAIVPGRTGTIIVADEGIVVASNDERLLGQNTADNEIVQKIKKHTDSRHIFHLKNEGSGGYGIMLKQRDYYIYAYLPDAEIFHDLPLSVTAVVFLLFSDIQCLLVLDIQNQSGTPEKEQEKEEKYKAELLKGSKNGRCSQRGKNRVSPEDEP